jgi:hypothetical protein
MRNSTCCNFLGMLAASLLLAGCAASSPAGALLSGARPPGVAKATLKRVTAPPGFHVGKCEFRPTGSNARCYRRTRFVSLDTATFIALIKASGLTVARDPLMWCRNLARRRPKVYVWDNCEARADLDSVEFAVFATAVKVLRGSSLRPRDLKVVRGLRGTAYEVTPVATDASPRRPAEP